MFLKLRPSKNLIFSVGVALTAGAGYAAWNKQPAEAGFGYVEENLEVPHLHWWHQESRLHSFDHAAIRRGFTVYNTLGKPCHSMKGQYYRQLIGVSHTEEEVRAIAEENDGYPTAPNEEGEIGTRTGTMNDLFKAPYANEKEARANNNGALPPDLTNMVTARHHGESYVYSILTGYRDPPHGVTLGENMYYNIYFPGGQISMPPPLAAGAVDYDDGTEASVAQMAKDVATFLAWSAMKDHDERKLMGVKAYAALGLAIAPLTYSKRIIWTQVKKRNVSFMRRFARD